MIGAKNFIGSLIDQWLQKWSNCKILSWDSLKPQKESFQERIFKSTQQFLFWMILTLWPKSCPIVSILLTQQKCVWYSFGWQPLSPESNSKVCKCLKERNLLWSLFDMRWFLAGTMVENDEVDDGVKCENRFLVPPAPLKSASDSAHYLLSLSDK